METIWIFLALDTGLEALDMVEGRNMGIKP